MQLPYEKIKREILIKREADTNPNYGCQPDKRPIEELLDYGVINLNKPKGPTSHMVSEYVQRILHVKKAGHGGTLDPGVTGVLPVAIGRATRIVQTLLPAGKEYVCIMHLHDEVPKDLLTKVITEFIGKIEQLPPVKSAVKREVRTRNIYYLQLIEIDGQDVLFRVGCQGGTYIRKLCHDIGRRLKTGAHMSELIRTKAGPFTDKNMATLQDLEDAYSYWKEDGNEKFLRYCIKPVEISLAHLPKIWIQDSAVTSLCHGASLNIPGVVKLNTEISKGDQVAIMTLKEELVALGESVVSTEQIMQEEKGICVKVSKVFMKEDVYPRQKFN